MMTDCGLSWVKHPCLQLILSITKGNHRERLVVKSVRRITIISINQNRAKPHDCYNRAALLLP